MAMPMIPRHRRSAGFTLIEMLVVLAIVAIMTAGALLSLSLLAPRDAPPPAVERLQQLLADARERAELENRAYGVRLTPSGYEFLVFDARSMTWLSLQDRRFSAGAWPENAVLALDVDGRRVLLSRQPVPGETLAPDFGVDATGEYTAFELRVTLGEREPPWRLRPDGSGGLRLDRAEAP